jgi:hypothetical protein
MHVPTAVRRAPRALARMVALAALALSAHALPAAAQPGAMFASVPELAEYRMNTGDLDRFVRATRALQALDEQTLDMDGLIENDPDNLDIGRVAAAMEREPRVRAAIEGAGMTTREYVTFMLAMLQAVFGSVMVQFGGENALRDLPEGALKHNIRFFMDNQHAFEALSDEG